MAAHLLEELRGPGGGDDQRLQLSEGRRAAPRASHDSGSARHSLPASHCERQALHSFRALDRPQGPSSASLHQRPPVLRTPPPPSPPPFQTCEIPAHLGGRSQVQAGRSRSAGLAQHDVDALVDAGRGRRGEVDRLHPLPVAQPVHISPRELLVGSQVRGRLPHDEGVAWLRVESVPQRLPSCARKLPLAQGRRLCTLTQPSAQQTANLFRAPRAGQGLTGELHGLEGLVARLLAELAHPVLQLRLLRAAHQQHEAQPQVQEGSRPLLGSRC